MFDGKHLLTSELDKYLIGVFFFYRNVPTFCSPTKSAREADFLSCTSCFLQTNSSMFWLSQRMSVATLLPLSLNLFLSFLLYQTDIKMLVCFHQAEILFAW